MTVKNPNFLQPNGFIVTIRRLPNVSYFCNSVTLPGMSANNPEQVNPFSRLPNPADKLDFDNLTLTFGVDEDLKNWSELMRWLVGFGFPKDFADFKFGVLDDTGEMPGSNNNFFSDIAVTVLSSHKNPVATFVYHNCIPQSVSGIDLTVLDSDITPIQCTATFDFSHFSILKPGSTQTLDNLE